METPRLIGRREEQARIGGLLDGAREGRSGALLVTGPAGIGKTALLRTAGEHARRRGLRTLGARGVEAEAEVAFAGLHELLAPVVALRGELPGHHRRALEVALGIESAVGEPPEPFAVAAALLALLGVVAERGDGLLVVLDDVHWFDAGSLEALLFVVRRLHAEGVAVLLSARPAPERGLRERGLDELALEGLGDDDARALVRSATGDRASAPDLRRIAGAARGYPLALVELGRAFADEPDRDRALDAAPQRPSQAVERVFRDDLRRLPSGVRRALLLAAADERATRTELSDAARISDLPRDALDAAERSGLLERDGTGLRFRHPLMQAVAYHGATSAEHDAAHRALAAVLPEDRAAWHRAAAADGPDEDVARGLTAAGRAAADRGDLAAGAVAVRRAVALTPRGPDAARRALLAAELSIAAGDLPQCRDLAEAALAGPADPPVRIDLERVRATALGRMGRLEEGVRPLLEHADLVATTDPRRAALLLLGAGPAFWFTGRLDRFATVVGRATQLTAEDHPVEHAMAGLLGAMVAVNAGRVGDAEDAIDRHEHVLERSDLPDPGYEVLASPAQVSVWTGQLERADALIERQLTVARRAGAAAALVYPLTVRGQLDLRRGRASSALAMGAEALSLGQDTRQTVLVGLAAAVLAQTEAALGRDVPCREHVALAHEIADATGSVTTAMVADAALGALELCLGRLEAALSALDRCARAATRTGVVEPNVARWQGDRIEVLARLGRAAEASEALAALRDHAAVSPTPWTLATVDRCAALLASDDGEATLAHGRAVARLDDAGDALEAARQRLALGERLRRGRQRRSAREPLRAALVAFERAGATPWAARTGVELRATGGTPEPGAGSDVPSRVDELTPRELRVALLVADGRTNPEVAAELFLSRKTVEHHLSQIYRKLGLRSRTELARELAGA